jgi:hypothetical protein
VVLEITKESLKEILNKKTGLINAFSEVIVERQNNNFKKIDNFLNRKEPFIQEFTAKIKSFFDLEQKRGKFALPFLDSLYFK